MTEEREIIIDATHGVLGRIAAYATRQALLGYRVVIVNCNNAIITGSKKDILANYNEKISKGKRSQKGPYFPRHVEGIFKRTVRGMLRYKKGRGREALKAVRCFADTPAEYIKNKKISLAKEVKTDFMTLKALSKLL